MNIIKIIPILLLFLLQINAEDLSDAINCLKNYIETFEPKMVHLPLHIVIKAVQNVPIIISKHPENNSPAI